MERASIVSIIRLHFYRCISTLVKLQDGPPYFYHKSPWISLMQLITVCWHNRYCKHLDNFLLIWLMCRWTISSTHYCHFTWWLHSLWLLFWTTLYLVVSKNVGCMFGLNLMLQGGNLLSPKIMSCPSELVGFSDGWNGLDFEVTWFF